MANKKYMININNQQYIASSGQSLLSIMIENGILGLKKNAVSGDTRFGICGMGTCFECEVLIEDLGIRRSCLINVDTDLNVQTGK